MSAHFRGVAGSRRLGMGSSGEGAGTVGRGRRRPCGSRADHEDGVVAGDGAEHARSSSALSTAPGEELGGTGRGPQHDQVGAGLGADEELGAEAGQPVPEAAASPPARPGGGRRPRRDGVHEGAGGGADPDGVELDQVARQRALGDVHPAPASRSASSGCERTSWPPTQVDDLLVPGALGRGPQGGAVHVAPRPGLPLEQPGDDRLLGVAAVLGLVPDHALRAVEHVGVDLLAAVGRQAVHDDRVGRGERHQLGGDRVVAERRQPGGGLLLLAHRDPRVGDDDVGAGRRPRRGSTITWAEPPVSAAISRARSTYWLLGLVALGRGDPDVQPGGGAGEQPGVAHVAGAVADEGDGRARRARPCAPGS